MFSGCDSEKKEIILSSTEKKALSASFFDLIYPPSEKMPAIVVDNFPFLGKLTALRFIEWVQKNPGGVIALPTGKTPQYFIKWVEHLLGGWNTPDIIAELEKAGINPSKKPDMKSLNFVQIDEFYPMDSSQENSFYYYVNHFYIDGFGLDRAKALMIDSSKIALSPSQQITDIWPENTVDLTLRYRQPKTSFEQRQKDVLARIDQWCMEYEQKIRKLGGIGFFLGGIGHDGHIGFNIKGSDHNSTARLCPINYETQAAAAVDLGGIETARKSLVITIGLGTITQNPDCTAIIIAAGATKAGVVADAMQSEVSVDFPATALRKLSNAKLFLTRGAISKLAERQLQLVKTADQISDKNVEKIIINLAAKSEKHLCDLDESEYKDNPFCRVMLSKRKEPFPQMAKRVHDSLINKIEQGMNVLENKCFLHTEPHHDDIMLGYFANVVRHFRRASNTHHFVTLTSGFTSVTNKFMAQQMGNLLAFLGKPEFSKLINQRYFAKSNPENRNIDVWRYLDGVASRNEQIKAEACARRLLRNLISLFDQTEPSAIEHRIKELKDYFQTQYPGGHDTEHIKQLKGMCREWEAECLWGYYGWKCDNVRHLRLGFYTGDIFTKDPTMDKDVPPIVDVMNTVKPDIITVAMDPEACGPDTHYKSLQAVAEALRIHEKQTGRSDIKIWGYRNVWYRFDPSEANIFVPVSLCMFSVMEQAFRNAFLSQKDASFPSYEYDGLFSELAQRIQVEQYQKIKRCLGREWFDNHPSPLIRATRGFVFLKQMTSEQFYKSCRELRRTVESS